MSQLDAERTLRHRVEEIARECGVLILVFVPIDMVVSDDPNKRKHLLPLLVLGVFLLVVSLLQEYRRLRRVD